MHQVFVGPYQVREIVKPNAYLIEDFEDRVIEVYNARRMRPHREPKYREIDWGGSRTRSTKIRRIVKKSVTASMKINEKSTRKL